MGWRISGAGSGLVALVDIMVTPHPAIAFTQYSDQAVGWTIWRYNTGSGKRVFSYPEKPNRFRGPPSRPYSGYRGPFPRINRSGRETAHGASTIAEIKMDSRRGQGQIKC